MELTTIIYIFAALTVIITLFYKKKNPNHKEDNYIDVMLYKEDDGREQYKVVPRELVTIVNDPVDIKKFESKGIPVHSWNEDYIRNEST